MNDGPGSEKPQKGSNIWTPVCSAMLNTIPGILRKEKKKCGQGFAGGGGMVTELLVIGFSLWLRTIESSSKDSVLVVVVLFPWSLGHERNNPHSKSLYHHSYQELDLGGLGVGVEDADRAPE